MTVQEAHILTTENLKHLYPDSEAAAISDWLLEWLTGWSKSERGMHRDLQLSDEQNKTLNDSIKRLLKNEPVQYVTNSSWFCGLCFYVNDQVLIPRPETEELVEWVISHCRFPYQSLSILDIGTGRGCIPVSLKKRLYKADIHAVDISANALAVAQKNSTDLGLPVQFHQLNILSAEERDSLGVFDFIISNPPYIPAQEKVNMEANVTEFEPSLALFVPDNDPLIFYRAIAEMGKTHLKDTGHIMVEMHAILATACQQLFQQYGYATEIKQDMQGKERMLRAWKLLI